MTPVKIDMDLPDEHEGAVNLASCERALHESERLVAVAVEHGVSLSREWFDGVIRFALQVDANFVYTIGGEQHAFFPLITLDAEKVLAGDPAIARPWFYRWRRLVGDVVKWDLVAMGP
jgi:hypothetical protein